LIDDWLVTSIDLLFSVSWHGRKLLAVNIAYDTIKMKKIVCLDLGVIGQNNKGFITLIFYYFFLYVSSKVLTTITYYIQQLHKQF
jgi:hypothetical protein